MGIVAVKTFQAPQVAQPKYVDDTVRLDDDLSMSIVGAENQNSDNSINPEEKFS